VKSVIDDCLVDIDICKFVNSGNINQSLMVLRNCIEILRENQKLGANKVCTFALLICVHVM